MPGAGGPAASLTEFLAAIQTTMYGLITDLTSRVTIIEGKIVDSPPPSSSTPLTTYVCSEPVVNYANLFPQTEILNGSPSIGTLTISGGTLNVGSVIVINANGSSSTGNNEETLTLTLYGSPEPPMLTCDSYLPIGYGGGIDATFVITMKETYAVVRATITNGTTISSSSTTLQFDRSVDCTFSLMPSWSSSEGGGVLTIESRTIEVKPPPVVS